jgi:hypothetical protein
MRPDILGHRVKVLLPGVPESMVIREELDAAAVEFRFDLVADAVEVLSCQTLFLFC